MLEKVEVRTSNGTLFTLPLLGTTEGYLVEDIEGLDPVPAIFVSSSIAQMDGEQFQTSRREKRNIVFKLEIDLDYLATSVETRRNYLYKVFVPKSQIHIRFYETSGRQVDINGHVESILSPRFTAEPRATISVLCFDSDFFVPTPNVINGATVSDTTELVHTYQGTVETGFLFQLNVNRLLPEFTIFNETPDGLLRGLEFSSADPLQAGDILRISTIPGNKYARLTRAGVERSVLYSVSPQANWIQLFEGDNALRVYAEGALIPYSITYTTKIGGL